MSTSQRVGTALAQTQALNHSLLLQFDHFNRVLNWPSLAEPTNVVQIDEWQPKALERLLDSLPTILRRGVDVENLMRTTMVHSDAKFGGDEDVFALVRIGREPFGDEVFGVSVFVRIADNGQNCTAEG